RVEAAEALGRAGDRRLREHRWVGIPAGAFMMGGGAKKHEVELDAFEIGRYPGTGEEYSRYVGGGGRERGDWDGQLGWPNRAVVYVSWHNATAYCDWAGVKLPTEAQMGIRCAGERGKAVPVGEGGAWVVPGQLSRSGNRGADARRAISKGRDAGGRAQSGRE